MNTSDLQCLVCPVCSAKFVFADGELACSACGAKYRVFHEVPLLLPGLRVRKGQSPEQGFVEELSRIAAPGFESEAQQPIHDLYSTEFHFPDQQLSYEGHRFLHRLRSSGFAIREPYGQTADSSCAQPSSEPPARSRPRSSVTLEVITKPKAVRAGSEFWVQVRIVNDGDKTLFSGGSGRSSVKSREAKARDIREMMTGQRLGERTSELLVDIPPSQAVTQPVPITASTRLGRTKYQVFLSEHGSRSRLSHTEGIEVIGVDPAAGDPLDMKWNFKQVERDYQQDHNHAVELLQGWLSTRLAVAANPVIVELGGNAAPMMARPQFDGLNASIYNVDIDPFGLVFGSVQRKHSHRKVQDVFGDGNQLPFADGFVDAVVMFATLHHFPDPARVLRHLKTKLTPNGVICILCEPIGHVTPDSVPPPFRDELVGGICEQAFEPWEWQMFFDDAQLRTLELNPDVGSLKVMLAAG